MVEKKLSQMILDKKLHGELVHVSSGTSFVKWNIANDSTPYKSKVVK